MKITKQAALDFENITGELEVQIFNLLEIEKNFEFMTEQSMALIDSINSLKLISSKCIQLNEFYWRQEK
jgi:hypothetical protein